MKGRTKVKNKLGENHFLVKDRIDSVVGIRDANYEETREGDCQVYRLGVRGPPHDWMPRLLDLRDQKYKC